MLESSNLPPITYSMTNLPSTEAPKRELKYWSALKILPWVQLALGISMILFSSISHGVSLNTCRCTLGTGIWVGALAVIAAGLGIGAFRLSYGDKCLLIGHFVMTIICTVADGILITISSFCLYVIIDDLNYYLRFWPSIDSTPQSITLEQSVIAIESLLLTLAFFHCIIAIVDTSFICCNWCQDSQRTVLVVYHPAPTAGGMDAKCSHVDVPSGAEAMQMIAGMQLVKSSTADSESS